MELVVFVGIPASGKSTFFRDRLAATHVLVSKDLMSRGNRDSKQQLLLTAAIGAGCSVVVDNNNPAVEDRAKLIFMARRYHAECICYYFPPDVATSLERNEKRKGKAHVPEVAIFAMKKRLATPTLAEGFDRIFVVRARYGCEFVVTQTS